MILDRIFGFIQWPLASSGSKKCYASVDQIGDLNTLYRILMKLTDVFWATHFAATTKTMSIALWKCIYLSQEFYRCRLRNCSSQNSWENIARRKLLLWPGRRGASRPFCRNDKGWRWRELVYGSAANALWEKFANTSIVIERRETKVLDSTRSAWSMCERSKKAMWCAMSMFIHWRL